MMMAIPSDGRSLNLIDYKSDISLLFATNPFGWPFTQLDWTLGIFANIFAGNFCDFLDFFAISVFFHSQIMGFFWIFLQFPCFSHENHGIFWIFCNFRVFFTRKSWDFLDFLQFPCFFTRKSWYFFHLGFS